ncbi:Putative Piso0_004049 protein [Rhizopus microsporus]|nr:Putative Piso0_004049 protein [Rhizopus microsporus]
MSLSIADVFEDYIESLQNLPFEVDQNMQELRRMDDDLQKYREEYLKSKRLYMKQCRSSSNSINLAPARLQLEHEFKTAMQKQDQKIELAMKMYDLVSRHIERLDSQVLKTGISEADWVRTSAVRKGPLSHKKRFHHSSRPSPSVLGHSAMRNEVDVDPNEPVYCYCNQISFGDMIACDGENCAREWFHYACVGFVEPPAGKWYCEDCKAKQYQYNNSSSSSSSGSDHNSSDEE